MPTASGLKEEPQPQRESDSVIPSAAVKTIDSKSAKTDFYKRPSEDWRDLAKYLEISPSHQRRLERGDKSRAIWHWLKSRHRLPKLPAALQAIKHADLAELLETASRSEFSAAGSTSG